MPDFGRDYLFTLDDVRITGYYEQILIGKDLIYRFCFDLRLC
jgi:hypothetical protein